MEGLVMKQPICRLPGEYRLRLGRVRGISPQLSEVCRNRMPGSLETEDRLLSVVLDAAPHDLFRLQIIYGGHNV